MNINNNDNYELLFEALFDAQISAQNFGYDDEEIDSFMTLFLEYLDKVLKAGEGDL